jgi:hypothetical protein
MMNRGDNSGEAPPARSTIRRTYGATAPSLASIW